jgi:hypothetical protein
VTLKTIDEVKPTALSRQIADATGPDCEHDWVWVAADDEVRHDGGYESAEYRAGSAGTLFEFTDTDDVPAGLIRFAQATGRSPRDVWNTLLRYIVSDQSRRAPLLDDMFGATRDADTFDAWLRDNYERVVEELNNPSPRRPRRQPDRDAADPDTEF